MISSIFNRQTQCFLGQPDARRPFHVQNAALEAALPVDDELKVGKVLAEVAELGDDGLLLRG